jgi:uncharacterized membrane protein
MSSAEDEVSGIPGDTSAGTITVTRVLMVLALACIFLFASRGEPTWAAAPVEPIYHRATVLSVGATDTSGAASGAVDVQVRLDNGREVTIVDQDSGGVHVSAGDRVVVTESSRPDGTPTFVIADRYRLKLNWYLVVGFGVLVVIVAGLRGIGALAGLVFSLFVILKFMVPQIVNGSDPLLISALGGAVILIATTYVAHGFSRQTTLAVAGTLSGLAATVVLAIVSVHVLGLSGGGSEDAAALRFGETRAIDLQGLLLAGIVIGTLGALNDMTTTQSATVFELARGSGDLTLVDLVRRSLSVGREHILSLVNTLVLAYAGAALVVFIFIDVNSDRTPWWVTLNSELISEEVVRTTAGGAGLLLSVPITTLLAAWYVTRGARHTEPASASGDQSD